MDRLAKFEPIFIFISIIIGFILSFNNHISAYSENLEEPLLMLLLFFIFLDIDFSEIKKAFKNIKFISTELAINFIWTPILAFCLAKLFLPDLSLQIALVLLLIMPCTDWYLIFTDITGGNTSLSSAILPINLILQLSLLPLYIGVFFGLNGTLNIDLAFDVFLEILIPILTAIILKILFTKIRTLEKYESLIDEIGEKAELVMVCLIAIAIFATHGMEFIKAPQNYPMFFLALLVFYIINFFLGLNLSKFEDFDKKDTISLVFTITARNTPLSLSIASLLFPHQVVISMALLIGTLTELPISALESFILKRLHLRKLLRNKV